MDQADSNAESSADSKIGRLLPRIVERAARRSDQKDEEPFGKPSRSSAKVQSAPASRLRRGTYAMLFIFAIWPAALGFVATGLLGISHHVVVDAKTGQQISLRCVGAPLIHSKGWGGGRQMLSTDGQFFPGAMLADALLWVAVAAGWSWWLWAFIAAVTGWKASGRRQFSVGELITLSVGVAVTLAAARWDWQLSGQQQISLKLTLEAFESGEPAPPMLQSLIGVSLLAAPWAYVGIGGVGAFLAWLILWVVSQFLPRRPDEEKPLLQQIF